MRLHGLRAGGESPLMVINQGAFAPRSYARGGFTLLELLLASMIAALMLSALYLSLNMSIEQTQASRDAADIEDLQRGVFNRMMIDLSSSLGPLPPKIAGKTEEWNARITEQVPDQVIAWEGFGDPDNRGRVFFEPLEGGRRTRISVAIEYEPQGVVEKVGDKLGVVERRLDGDLRRFKEFIESRGTETGGWRGEIHERPTGTG